MVPATDTVELEAFGAEHHRSFPRRQICEMIQARVEEILELIVKEVSQATELELVSAGIVFTGAGARLPGLDLLAEQVTLLPARIGHPVHIFGLVDELHDPAFAASVGLLQWAVGAGDLVPAVRLPSGPSAFDGMFKKLGNWFRVLLPE
jgi:cell division protein FtsA